MFDFDGDGVADYVPDWDGDGDIDVNDELIDTLAVAEGLQQLGSPGRAPASAGEGCTLQACLVGAAVGFFGTLCLLVVAGIF